MVKSYKIQQSYVRLEEGVANAKANSLSKLEDICREGVV